MEFSEKSKEMENESDDDGSELIHEAFICCVCRDVLYKPVVLACGHISCFWCIHKSMSGLHKSRCPICRNRYYHFPSICQTLHLMLLKMYPVAYEKRGNQILEDEKLMGYFSPQLIVPADKVQPKDPVILSHDSLQPCLSRADSSLNPCSIGKEEIPGRMEQVGPDPVHPETDIPNLQAHKEDTLTTNAISVKDKNMNPGNSNLRTWKPVSADEVLCGSCKRVLFRPAVLNCGHVFCKCCIIPPTNEMLMCEVCQHPHPSDIPKVCLEFDHFLEEQFPKEYGLRKGSWEADKNKVHFPFSSGEDHLPLWDASSNVHIGLGCDACGPSQATVRNWVVRILQNRRVVPFRVDKVHCYRETDQLEPMLDESRDDQLNTEEDLACCMADFLIRAMNKYSQAGGEQLEISLLMEKLVTIPNQEFEAWMSWFQEQKRLNPNDFQNEYMAAIRVPRTLHELWYEASLRNCKSATDSCIESLEKLALEEECADSLGISCAICIEDLDQVEEVTKLPCLHLFHRECIVQWLKRSHFCPICRFNMPTS